MKDNENNAFERISSLNSFSEYLASKDKSPSVSIEKPQSIIDLEKSIENTQRTLLLLKEQKKVKNAKRLGENINISELLEMTPEERTPEIMSSAVKRMLQAPLSIDILEPLTKSAPVKRVLQAPVSSVFLSVLSAETLKKSIEAFHSYKLPAKTPAVEDEPEIKLKSISKLETSTIPIVKAEKPKKTKKPKKVKEPKKPKVKKPKKVKEPKPKKVPKPPKTPKPKKEKPAGAPRKTKGKAFFVVSICIFLASVTAFAMFVFPSVGTIYSYFTKQAQPYTNSLDLQAGKVKVSSNFASLSADDIEKIKQAVSSLPSNLPADSKVGVEVIDTKGSEVASLNKSEQLPPASTLKTLTALAASNSLDLSKTLDTKAVLSTDEGTLTLVGAGDMLLGAGQSDKNAINGRAGLASLANDAVTALKAKKISSVSLAYSNMFKNNEPVPPAYVSENYLSSGDYAPLSSYAINEGRVGTADLSPRVDNPALGVASSFADALRAGGIQVNDTSEQAYNENPAGSTLSYVSSAPLRDMLQYTLSNSDNTLAEEFGRFVGLSVSNSLDRKTSLMAVKSVITKLGINLNSSVIDDCSGLSATNRLTADVLAKVQKKMQNETFALLPARGLPISGYSGSLADSFHEDYIKDGIVGYVRAKTGTLARTASLSGVFMKDASKPIIFSVIINTASENTLGQAKEAIDIFVNSLL